MNTFKLVGSLFFVVLIALATSCGTQADESIGSIGLTENELQANYMVEIDRKSLAPWQDSILVEALNKITGDTVPMVHPDTVIMEGSRATDDNHGSYYNFEKQK